MCWASPSSVTISIIICGTRILSVTKTKKEEEKEWLWVIKDQKQPLWACWVTCWCTAVKQTERKRERRQTFTDAHCDFICMTGDSYWELQRGQRADGAFEVGGWMSKGRGVCIRSFVYLYVRHGVYKEGSYWGDQSTAVLMSEFQNKNNPCTKENFMGMWPRMTSSPLLLLFYTASKMLEIDI